MKSSTKYAYELIAFDPGNAGYGVSKGPIFKTFFPGELAPAPPYIIRAFGADSPLVFPITLCLVFSYKNTPRQDKRNDGTKSSLKQKIEHQRKGMNFLENSLGLHLSASVTENRPTS